MKRGKLCPTQQKLMYPTKTAAIRAALSYSKRRGVPLRVYWHRECKSFHLTHLARGKVDIHAEEGGMTSLAAVLAEQEAQRRKADRKWWGDER